MGPARYVPVRRYPTSAFDLSIVTPMCTPVGDIESDIRAAARNLVALDYLRQYTGPQAGEGNKSVSFRITLGASDHTLSSEEITTLRATIIDTLRAKGYDLRI
jgi:phenylalanyl-tRNA synthetase beta chain